MTEAPTAKTARKRKLAAEYVLAKLSPRETEVFRRVVAGETLIDIAAALSLSHSSISTYRNRVLVKLGQKTTPDLVVLAVYLGLVEKYGE